jgi:thiosulfate/3-mercaptopyruvate sulfurtransferase
MRTKQPALFRCIGGKEAEYFLRSEGVLVLDARDGDAFRRGHITGAQHVTISGLCSVIEGADKNTPVVIYCYRGFASREYAQLLADLGFSQVYSLDGGYEAWRKKQHAPGKARWSSTAQRWLAEHGFAPDDVNGVIANSTTPLMKASTPGRLASSAS